MGASTFLTFISGLDIISVQIGGGSSGNGSVSAAMPSQPIAGQTYILITNTAVSGAVTDDQVIAGPAVIEIAPAPPVLNNTLLKA